MAAVVGLALAVPQLFRRVDEMVRQRVERRLGEAHPELQVGVRSAALVQGKGIEIRGVSIREPGMDGPEGELLYIEEIFVSCRTDLEELLKGEPEVHRILVRRPTLRTTRGADGSWNIARLVPRVHTTDAEVRVESGTIEVLDASKSPSRTLVLRDVLLTVRAPDPSPPGGVKTRKFEGTLSGDLLRQVEVSGQIEPERQAWSLAGTAEGLEICPDVCGALPFELAGKMDMLGALRAEMKVRFSAAYQPQAEPPLNFDVSAQLSQGRLDHPRLPHSLSGIHAAIHVNNEGLSVENASARSGSSALNFSYRRAGFRSDSPSVLRAELRDVELDRQLVDFLPESLQAAWYKYLPAGQVSADAKLSFDGSTWTPEVTLQCLNVSFTYHKFPYRLERASGVIELKDDLLTANLTAYAGNRPVRCSAEVHRPLSEEEYFGWMEARGDELQLDEKLLGSVPEKARKIIRSLEPRGTVNARFRAEREGPGGPVQRHLLVGLNHCAVRYEKFAYPISNISGTLELRDDRWSFRDLAGTNDTARITASGYLTPTPHGQELRLWLAGTRIPMEQELRDALQPGMQQLWDNLRPQGTVDLLRAEVCYTSEPDKVEVSLRARPRSENAAIQPVNFPYRLEKLSGVLDYRDGLVKIEQLQGEHGSVRAAADGFCEFSPDGGWRFVLEKLDVDRVRLDRELTQALPNRLKKGLTELNPQGAINLHGWFALARAGNANAPLTSAWDMGIEFQQASVDCGIRLENLNGGVRLNGQSDGEHFACRGELDIDSLTCRDYQFTRVAGPVWIDDQRVLLGNDVDRPLPGSPHNPAPDPNRPPRPITAQLFGGAVQADGWVALAEVPRFDVRATLDGAELERLAQEVVAGRQNLRGKIAATVNLRGAGRSINGLGGRGSIRLRDADVYELPVMISLLKVLSIREPDRRAFSTSDIDFRVEGKNIYLDRIDFNGDAVSLKGRGEMNLQQELQLTFHALVGRGDNLPLLQHVLGGASQQIMLIHVNGTLQTPETSREAFPGVNQALQHFQADLSPDPSRRLPRKF